MTREQIEKAANNFLLNEPLDLPKTVIGAFKEGFINGAEWISDKLCNIPWDKSMKELHEYCMEKERNANEN